jgi:uncharacterized protein YggE
MTLAVILMSGCRQGVQPQQQSTVSVAGTGTVAVAPDMVRVNIALSHTAPKTRQAQHAVNNAVAPVLAILKSEGVEDKDVSTSSLTFNPEYEYRPQRRVLVGQRVEQRIEFAIHGIRDNSEKVSGIIDRLAHIDGIELNGIHFDVNDKAAHFTQSRELAFAKARQKAEEYAALSGLRVTRVLSISEEGAQRLSPMQSNQMRLEMQTDAKMAASTILPSGEMEITTRIEAVFLLEQESYSQYRK